MVQYRRWRVIKVVNILNGLIVENKPKEMNCDGYFLFGKLPLFTRENING